MCVQFLVDSLFSVILYREEKETCLYVTYWMHAQHIHNTRHFYLLFYLFSMRISTLFIFFLLLLSKYDIWIRINVREERDDTKIKYTYTQERNKKLPSKFIEKRKEKNIIINFWYTFGVTRSTLTKIDSSYISTTRKKCIKFVDGMK